MSISFDPTKKSPSIEASSTSPIEQGPTNVNKKDSLEVPPSSQCSFFNALSRCFSIVIDFVISLFCSKTSKASVDEQTPHHSPVSTQENSEDIEIPLHRNPPRPRSCSPVNVVTEVPSQKSEILLPPSPPKSSGPVAVEQEHVFSEEASSEEDPSGDAEVESFTPIFKKWVDLEGEIVAEVRSYLRDSGYLGRDGEYGFGKKITLLSGQPLVVAPDDHYCLVEITREGEEEKVQLPSSLFKQAKVNDEIQFYWEGKLCRLQPKSRPFSKDGTNYTFDEYLKSIEDEAKLSPFRFQHKSDIPENYFRWPGSSLFYLSPDAQRIVVGQTGILPVDFAALKPLSSKPGTAKLHPMGGVQIREEGTTSWLGLYFEAQGRPDADLILDNNRLYLHLTNITLGAPREQLKHRGTHEDYFSHRIVDCDGKVIDPTRIIASLQDDGLLKVQIPFIPPAG